MNQRAMLLVLLCCSIAVAQPAAPPTTVPATPLGFDDAQTFVFRASPELRLHVVKPKDFANDQRRPAFVYFFGGGWVKGSPEKSIGWARMAAKWGMVGIAPDYRVKDRFNGTTADCVADARLALRWVQDHADELGIDPAKIVVGGGSAGGHVALWTALSNVPPGSTSAESPKHQPAALVLMSALTDTSYGVYGKRASQSGYDGQLLSPQHHLDAKMPPTILFHGDADKTVEHSQSVNLNQKLVDSGNVAELVTVPGGSHGFSTDLPEWKDKSREMIREFLRKQKLID